MDREEGGQIPNAGIMHADLERRAYNYYRPVMVAVGELATRIKL